ncbi:DUF664 domain-containing protein [Pseudonocardia sp. H11422]|uniref:mycothiol transferase n=1 Tax=Pseudonocardia sp. H11422 TaxID=2835866 RepID=UPI0027E3732B|nr:DUF664 domain-containing protein [Pseudonocardia sp. H11422]
MVPARSREPCGQQRRDPWRIRANRDDCGHVHRPRYQRADAPTRVDERATLVGSLPWQRDTLELKCFGLDAADLARRPVEPSALSLLGLVRHMWPEATGRIRYACGSFTTSVIGAT